jgi:hypothetical protein
VAALAAGGWTGYRAYEQLVTNYAEMPGYNLLERFVVYERSPEEAMAFFRENGLQPRVLCEWEFAGPIMFEVPGAKVFIDGRSQQVYDETHMLRYGALIRDRLKAEAFDWLDETGTEAILLHRRDRKVRPFLMSCARNAKWRNVLCTPQFALFLREDGAMLAKIRQRERAGDLWWPDSAEAVSTRGILWVDMVPSDDRRGLEYLQTALDRDPSVGLWSLRKMQQAFFRTGQRAAGKDYFRALLERVNDPDVSMLSEDRQLLQNQLKLMISR